MIKRWKIANFKSIRDETTLDLAPLTIFAGANSSGKSTVLQSILLIAQTLEHKISSKSVVLNGSLSKLGQFKDLISDGTDVAQISIGWHCEPIATGVQKINSVECELSFDATRDPLEEGYDAYQLQPRLHRFELNSNLSDHNSTDNNVSICVFSSDKNYPLIQKLNRDDNIFSFVSEDELDRWKRDLSIETEIDGISLADIQETIPLIHSVYTSNLNHFLPKTLGVKKLKSLDIANKFISVICNEPLDILFDSIIKGKLSTQLSDDIQEKVLLSATVLIEYIESLDTSDEIYLRFLRKKLESISEEMLSLRSLADIIQKLPQRNRDENIREIVDNRSMGGVLSMGGVSLFVLMLKKEGGDFRKEMIKDDFKKIIEWPPSLDFVFNRNDNETENIRPKFLSSAIEYIDRIFSEQVKYLGPLRDEPRHIYPINTLVDPENVGTRGEQTAAVLHIHRKTTIKYLPVANFPSANSELSEIERTPVSKSLMDAVCEWAQYLGVVEDIQVSDHGKLGHSIKVGQDRKITSDIPEDLEEVMYNNDDGSSLWVYYRDYLENKFDNSKDLTHVGVGVSQVLPILVMGLLSKEDTTLIFEQPELHLHPLVQTRLADFFLSMSLLKKQCIIETHSEHLINRLRFRAATASVEEPLTDTSKIYFVEKVEGTSRFKEVVINEYGSIQDWPSGFFDQSYSEAENILMASIKKRKKMRKRKDK